jgi:signal transduction histidine kinase
MLYILLYFCISLANFDALLAQKFDLRKNQLDSLISVKDTGDLAKDLDRYNQIAWEWRYYSTDSALVWAQKGYKKSETIPLRKRQLANTLASIYRIKSMADSAHFYYDVAFELAASAKDSADMARYLNNRSLVFKDVGSTAAAAEVLNQAMEIRRQIGDSAGYFGSMINMAVLVKGMGQIDQAISYYKMAGDFYRRNEVPLRAIIADINLSLAYKANSQNMQALQTIERALTVIYSQQLLQYEGISRSVRGDINIALNQWDKAIPDLKFALSSAKTSGEIVKQSEAANALASAYLKDNQRSKALEILEVNKKLIEKYPDLIEQQSETDAMLMRLYQENGSWQKAFQASERLLIWRDSLTTRERISAFAKEREQFDTALKEEQLSKQALEIAVQDALLSSQKWAISALALAFIGTLVSILFWFNGYKQRVELAKKELALKSKKAEMQAVIQTQDKERSRLARELHDGVVQELTSLLMQSRASSTMDNEISDKLDSLAQEVRGLSHEIMPRSLQEKELVSALNDMVKRSFDLAGIQLNAFNSIQNEELFSDDLRKTVYRIAQEMVQNVIKHADASTVEMSFVANQERLLFSLVDDGKGADLEKIRYGIGLQNMDIRAKLIGGRVEIKQNEGQSGLEVLLWIPQPYTAKYEQISENLLPLENSIS